MWTDKGNKSFNLTGKLRAGVIWVEAPTGSFLEASEEDLVARRGAGTERSRGYVRVSATKYGSNRPLRSPKDGPVVASDTYNKFDPTTPFGGYKESGYGREGGLHGLGASTSIEV